MKIFFYMKSVQKTKREIFSSSRQSVAVINNDNAKALFNQQKNIQIFSFLSKKKIF